MFCSTRFSSRAIIFPDPLNLPDAAIFPHRLHDRKGRKFPHTSSEDALHNHVVYYHTPSEDAGGRPEHTEAVSRDGQEGPAVVRLRIPVQSGQGNPVQAGADVGVFSGVQAGADVGVFSGVQAGADAVQAGADVGFFSVQAGVDEGLFPVQASVEVKFFTWCSSASLRGVQVLLRGAGERGTPRFSKQRTWCEHQIMTAARALARPELALLRQLPLSAPNSLVPLSRSHLPQRNPSPDGFPVPGRVPEVSISRVFG